MIDFFKITSMPGADHDLVAAQPGPEPVSFFMQRAAQSQVRREHTHTGSSFDCEFVSPGGCCGLLAGDRSDHTLKLLSPAGPVGRPNFLFFDAFEPSTNECFRVVFSQRAQGREADHLVNGSTPITLAFQRDYPFMVIRPIPGGSRDAEKAFYPPHILNITLTGAAEPIVLVNVQQFLGHGVEGAVHLYLGPGGTKYAIKVPNDTVEAKSLLQETPVSETPGTPSINFSEFSTKARISRVLGKGTDYQVVNRELKLISVECLQFMEGVNVDDAVRGGLSFSRWMNFSREMIDFFVISFLKKHGVSHQDVHGGNVHMIKDDSCELRVLDLSKMSRRNTDCKPLDFFVPHVPPEVLVQGSSVAALPTAPLDKTAHDLWAVGAVLLQGILGQSAFKPEDTKSSRSVERFNGIVTDLLSLNSALFNANELKDLQTLLKFDERCVMGHLFLKVSQDSNSFLNFMMQLLEVFPRFNQARLTDPELSRISEILRLFLCPHEVRLANFEGCTTVGSDAWQQLNNLLLPHDASGGNSTRESSAQNSGMATPISGQRIFSPSSDLDAALLQRLFSVSEV